MAHDPSADAERRSLPPLTGRQDEIWATASHAGAVFGILPALIIYATLGARGRRTLSASKAAGNFQCTVWAAIVGCYILSAVTTLIPLVGRVMSIGLWLLAAVVYMISLIVSGIAAVRTTRGEDVAYPLSPAVLR